MVLRLLLASPSIDIHTIDSIGRTPLHIAAKLACHLLWVSYSMMEENLLL